MANSKKQTTIAVLLVALFSLLGLSGYLWFDRNQMKTENEQQREEIIEVERIQAELEIEYEDAMTSLTSLKTDNDELNAKIEGQIADLNAQKKKVKDLLWVQKKYKEANSELESLKSLSATYLAEIQDLRNKNQVLLSENSTLTEEKTVLTQTVNQERQAKEELQTAKAQLVSEKTKLEDYNLELSKKVDLASVIRTRSIIGTPYKVRNNGKLIRRTTAKGTDKVTVCFTTEANLIADTGTEEFYVRIIDPLGETMAIESLGSGVMMNQQTNEPLKYTIKGSLDYENEKTHRCVDWNPGGEWQRGSYDVEVYNKGVLSGKSNFTLK